MALQEVTVTLGGKREESQVSSCCLIVRLSRREVFESDSVCKSKKTVLKHSKPASSGIGPLLGAKFYFSGRLCSLTE